jgi:outer membrane receptor for ferrienterochelin and colicins
MRRGAITALLGMTAAGPVAAQSIDYGAFEELFGEPVTTSANGTPQRPSDVPADMEIITPR